jgi:DNA-binding transcriptional ArsR family regulator
MSVERPLSRLSEDELLDTLYKTLANRDRRRILRYLADHPEPISTSELAAEMGTLEHDSESPAVPTEQQSNTHVSLFHIHLPILNKTGLISWDRDKESVTISSELEELVVTTTGNVLDVAVSVGQVK